MATAIWTLCLLSHECNVVELEERWSNTADISRKEGATHLHVVGNPHAKSFYLACRFEVIGATQTRFGPGLLMRRAVRLPVETVAALKQQALSLLRVGCHFYRRPDS